MRDGERAVQAFRIAIHIRERVGHILDVSYECVSLEVFKTTKVSVTFDPKFQMQPKHVDLIAERNQVPHTSPHASFNSAHRVRAARRGAFWNAAAASAERGTRQLLSCAEQLGMSPWALRRPPPSPCAWASSGAQRATRR